MVSGGVPTADLWRGRRIHLVGIGGFGMSALAQVLQGRGAVVSGSDMRASPLTEKLESLDIEFDLGHRPDSVRGKDLVVASSAIPQDNEELVAAQELGIPVWGRPQLLRELSDCGSSGTNRARSGRKDPDRYSSPRAKTGVCPR